MKDRVVFYSKYDMSLGWQYDRIADLINEKDKWPEYNDIEDVVELYHLMLVIETGIHPNTLSDVEWKEYQEAASGVKKIAAKRFNRVTDATIEEELEKIDISYKESFWEILFAFGGADRIDGKTVEGLLNNGKANILHFLRNKKAIQTYGEVVKRYLQNNLSYAREMITEYLEKRVFATCTLL